MKKKPELQWSPSPSGLEQLYGRDTILKSAAEQAVGFGFHLQVNSQERCPAAVTTSAGGGVMGVPVPQQTPAGTGTRHRLLQPWGRDTAFHSAS